MSNEGDEGWEDDEMEELFSFGNDGGGGDGGGAGDSLSEPVMVETPIDQDAMRDRNDTADSFLEMLDDDAKESSVVLDANTTSAGSSSLGDAETQEILNWLDQDEPELLSEPPATVADLPAPKSVASHENITVKASASPAPSVVSMIPDPEPTFDRLSDALVGKHAAKATVDQIRQLFVSEGMNVAEELRPELWSRIVCNKTLTGLQASSVADSYCKWQASADIDSFTDERSVWIKLEAGILAERITCMPQDEAVRQLSFLLLFHYTGNSTKDMDPLLPPVACAILSAGLPAGAASVVLSNIMPTFMPLLALTQKERLHAARQLHSQFYLLASYHLPLLVFHLDRYAPGWHWPKKLERIQASADEDDHAWRNTESHGVVPQSWLISQMAGECNGTFMNPKWLLSLWDLILTSSNNSLRFFLSLAVLEKHSDSLLMVTGDELRLELTRIMEFKEGTTLEGFAIMSDEETTFSEATDWVQEWCARARSLWESTPRSVVGRLRKAEDEAVAFALTERQRKAEAELHAKLEAEAKAHKDAMEAEREKRAAEGRDRLNRAKLVAFYREFAPDKEGNVDAIMETFAGRFDVLDSKLKLKYGHGFKPALPPKLSKNASKLLSTMNIGLSNQGRRANASVAAENDSVDAKKEHPVSVRVSPVEVLPIICWAKETDPIKKASNRPCDSLKFYLVDSRPEETVQEQGGFPTALAMPPEALLDPDRMKQQEEIFESLRGAAHIVVMGEGFSEIPALYGQKLNPSLTQLIGEDESRTSLCALFFAKKGFPFVSILEGGFCGAHAWLSRQGPRHHLHVDSVLVDYAGEHSMFGALEKAYREQKEFENASAAEKTSMALEGLFVKSMTSITRNKLRLENLASSAAAATHAAPSATESLFSNFFKHEEKKDDQKSPPESSKFRMPFMPPSSTETPVPPVPQQMPPPPAEAQSDEAQPGAQPTMASTSITKEAAPVTLEKPVLREEDPNKTNRFGALGAARLGGIGNALTSSMAKIGMDKPVADIQSSAEGRFAGLGAAFNKQLKNATNSGVPQQIPNVLKRNPFARFGPKDQSEQPTPAPRFGMSQMRTQLATFRAGPERQEESVIDFENMQ
ncbi:hypothetical protein MHU86_1140 [Fragilaria crotonensis]|nr:hypothetical protein MHU86_1140 [Fragilaria crotonensis]